MQKNVDTGLRDIDRVYVWELLSTNINPVAFASDSSMKQDSEWSTIVRDVFSNAISDSCDKRNNLAAF